MKRMMPLLIGASIILIAAGCSNDDPAPSAPVATPTEVVLTEEPLGTVNPLLEYEMGSYTKSWGDASITISNVISTSAEFPGNWHEEIDAVIEWEEGGDSAIIAYHCVAAPVTLTVNDAGAVVWGRHDGGSELTDNLSVSYTEKFSGIDLDWWSGTLVINSPGVYMIAFNDSPFDMSYAGFYVVVGD